MKIVPAIHRFSAHCSKRFAYIVGVKTYTFLFLKIDRDTGWVLSYLRRLYLDFFQTTKRYSYDGYSIYIAIFNSFHEAVYPVGVTTNRSCFTRIIGHNS